MMLCPLCRGRLLAQPNAKRVGDKIVRWRHCACGYAQKTEETAIKVRDPRDVVARKATS